MLLRWPRSPEKKTGKIGAPHAPVDFGSLGFSDFGHRARFLLGLLRTGLGRFLVLGSGRKRLLMPWLAGTALLHSALVAEKRDTLKRWTLLLAIITFALSLSGTFLVRSGVLTSVHAFANDPERGLFILAILGLFTLAGFLLYGLRLPHLAADRPFQPVSREGLLLVNNIFLATATVTVFIGTIYPLILDALGMGKIFRRRALFQCGVCAADHSILLLPLGPLLNWRTGSVQKLQNKLALAAAAAALVTCGIMLTRGAVR